MAVLLFNRSRSFHFAEWLRDLDEELVLFTQVPLPDLEKYRHVEVFESFDTNGWTEIRALELHQSYRFTRVIGHSEYDLIRAARLRERFGIDGQRVESALAYRNKVVMKQLAAEAGVEVPAFRRLRSPVDLYEFVEAHGFPVVVKPVDGGGSRNTRVLSGFEEMKSFLTSGWPANFMVETYVAGDMYHVDGIVRNGEVLFSSVSRYVNGCLAFNEGRSLGSVLLSPSSALSDRLNQAVRAVLSALPGAPVLAFHAEFFLTEDDRLVLCEIASRTGGGRIVDTIRHVFGVDLNRLWVRFQCGLDDPVPSSRETAELAGSLVVPPKRGRLLSLPREVPFDWVVDYSPSVQPNQMLSRAVSSVDNIATFIVRGPTEEAVESRLHMVDDWFCRSLEWEGEPMYS